MTQPQKYAQCMVEANEKRNGNGEGGVIVKRVADVEQKNACRDGRNKWYR
jgi:hypothetical protein